MSFFAVGTWVEYLPDYPSSQWGIVIALRPCNHLVELFPIVVFESNQVRFVSKDFARSVNYSEVPLDTRQSVIAFSKEVLEEEWLTNEDRSLVENVGLGVRPMPFRIFTRRRRKKHRLPNDMKDSDLFMY